MAVGQLGGGGATLIGLANRIRIKTKRVAHYLALYANQDGGGKGEGALAISMNTLGKFPDSKDAILL